MGHRAATLLVLLFFAIATQADPPQKIITRGTFSNYQYTDEHQYGAGVQIWQEGSGLFGIFANAQGLIGDTPTGVLENISFDSKTGRISFTAKLTMGLHSCKTHENIPSQDIFNFAGVLTATTLAGTLQHADKLHQENVPTEEKVVLEKSEDWIVTQFQNREQWKAAVTNILKLRGPKW
jgi:hypothetical protein